MVGMKDVMLQLSKHFPITFKNGHEVTAVSFWCTHCGQIQSFQTIQGRVSRLIESVADVEASFTCQECGHFFQRTIRLRADKTYSYHTDSGQRATESTRLGFRKALKLRAVGYMTTMRLRLFSRGIAKQLSKLINKCADERNWHDKV